MIPLYRPRRLRQSETWRGLVRETRLSIDQLVMPLFVRPGQRIRSPITSLPGQYQFSLDELVKECHDLRAHHVPAILLFGLAEGKKDERGSGAFAKDGLLQQAVRAVKAAIPELLVITDVCLCAYTTHGHCGVVRYARGSGFGVRGKARKRKGSTPPTQNPPPRTERDFYIDNDATLELLGRVAVSHAQAGADMVAPSDMMDGNVGAIRRALDAAGHDRVPIMGYSAKYASSFYGPFREAANSAPAFGDRRSYQMDIANAEEALREARLDLEQGADLMMVKPALAYLDVIWRIKQELRCPVAAFNVSGEYAMVKAVAAKGWMTERLAWLEMLTAIKRAGADVIITYWAKDAAKLLRDQ